MLEITTMKLGSHSETEVAAICEAVFTLGTPASTTGLKPSE